MKKAIYERPSTLRFSVALEGNFAGSADVANPNTNSGKIDDQVIVDWGEDAFGDENSWTTE